MMTVLNHDRGAMLFSSRAALLITCFLLPHSASSGAISAFSAVCDFPAFPPLATSEESSQLEIEPMVSPIPHAPPKHNRTDKRLNEHSRIEIVGKARITGIHGAVSLAQLVRRNQIDIVSQERRQLPQPVNVTRLKEKILVSEQFVGSVSGQPLRPPQLEHRDAGTTITQGRTSGSQHEHRSGSTDALEDSRPDLDPLLCSCWL